MHLLRPGEWGLFTQILLAGLHYIYPAKPHSHPGHGTNVTLPVLLKPLQAGFKQRCKRDIKTVLRYSKNANIMHNAYHSFQNKPKYF